MFGERNLGIDFEWEKFRLSAADCKRIGLGIETLQKLESFTIHRSKLDDYRAVAILQHIAINKTLTHLDLTHCKISDEGALAIANVITVHPTLEHINLTNNKIGARGAEGLAFALVQNGGCPLMFLSLRLNVLGDEGATKLCAGLATSQKPMELVLAACGIGEKGAKKIAQMLQQNNSLFLFDLSNNHLGEFAGEYIELALRTNKTLAKIDLRMTDIPSDCVDLINTLLEENMINYKKYLLELEEKKRNKREDDEVSSIFNPLEDFQIQDA